MAWCLLLLGSTLSAAERDGVHDWKLARGWVTAHILRKGMPAWAWEAACTGMECTGGSSSLTATFAYREYGLYVSVRDVGRRLEVCGAQFWLPSK
jgi:hypothetical protein